MVGYDFLPEAMRLDLEDQTELRNLPCIVSHDNVFYTSTQTNIAPAIAEGEDNSLGENLGVAGGPHKDGSDYPVNGSLMYFSSDFFQNFLNEFRV